MRDAISGTQSGQWGLLPPTGKQVFFDEIVILELEDGRVVRQGGIADNLTALSQLGVLPGQGSADPSGGSMYSTDTQDQKMYRADSDGGPA